MGLELNLDVSAGIESYVNSFLYLLTVLVPVYMLAWQTPRRKNFTLRLVVCILVMVGVIELINLVTETIKHTSFLQYLIYIYSLKYLIVYLLSGLCIKICFDCGWWGALFCATAGYCMQHIQARLASIVQDFLMSGVYWIWIDLVSLAIAAFAYAIFYAIVIRGRENHTLNVANKGQVVIATCVVGINIFYNSFGISYISATSRLLVDYGLNTVYLDYLLMFVYVLSLMVAFLALALDLGLSRNQKLSDEKAMLSNILEESKRQYEREKSNLDMMNVKLHDIKHQLGAMKGKIYEEQLDELVQTVNIYDSEIKTGNEALDVVLTQKNFYCTQHGIRLCSLLNGDHFKFIAHYELYTLFMNALDNAIEAVEKLPEEMRVISITESMAKNLLTVHVENYCDGGLPLTDKKGEGHGLGVRSMRMIAKKYGGDLSVRVEHGIFLLDIWFDMAVNLNDACK